MLMSTYYILVNYTGQGIKAVKDSPERVRAAKRLAEDCGAKFQSVHITLGQYDIIIRLEAPNDEAVARFALAMSSLGFVRTTTLRGFTEEEFETITDSLP
jgi:uncharacterized protein with GYD domain